MTSAQRWKIAYRLLWAAFIGTAALNMLHVRAGFFTSYAADLTVPALLYVMIRGLAEPDRAAVLLQRWFGGTPERTALVLFLASVATEISQLFWPKGFFAGRFDPLDIGAYVLGLAICYVCDKRSSKLA